MSTLKEKDVYISYSGFTPGTRVFSHYTPARQGYTLPAEKWKLNLDNIIKRVTKGSV